MTAGEGTAARGSSRLERYAARVLLAVAVPALILGSTGLLALMHASIHHGSMWPSNHQTSSLASLWLHFWVVTAPIVVAMCVGTVVGLALAVVGLMHVGAITTWVWDVAFSKHPQTLKTHLRRVQ